MFFLPRVTLVTLTTVELVSNLSAEESEVLSMLYIFTESHRKISVRKPKLFH